LISASGSLPEASSGSVDASGGRLEASGELPEGETRLVSTSGGLPEASKGPVDASGGAPEAGTSRSLLKAEEPQKTEREAGVRDCCAKPLKEAQNQPGTRAPQVRRSRDLSISRTREAAAVIQVF